MSIDQSPATREVDALRLPQFEPLGVQLWRADLAGGVAAADIRILADDELRRAARYRRVRDRARSIAARAAVRRILAPYVDADPAAISFLLERGGRPRLHDGGPTFSTSHAGDVLLVAVRSEGAVGVDVERLDEDLDVRSLATVILPPPMAGQLAAMTHGDAVHAFLRHWTLLEAYLKALGVGFRADPLRHPIRLVDESVAVLLDDADNPSAWRLRTFVPLSGHIAALAIDSVRP